MEKQYILKYKIEHDENSYLENDHIYILDTF